MMAMRSGRTRLRLPSGPGRKSRRTSRVVLAGLVGGLAAACTPMLPPIADVGNDAAFKSEIALRYGPGTPAATLRATLAGQGFVVTPSEVPQFRYSATNAEPNLPCFSYVRVDWNEDRRGRISLIQASRLQCR